jgi:hypothetical protein
MSRGNDLDVLAQVAALPGVSEAANAAREAVDQLLWDRAVLARSAQIITESRIRGAHASASLDGVDADLDGVRSGSLVDDSPLGRALAAALRLSDELPSLVATFRTSPPQALAAAHAVTAIEFDDDALAELFGSASGPAGKYLKRQGLKVQRRAKRNCPVDTGRLRSSITEALGSDSQGLVERIGTDVRWCDEGPRRQLHARRTEESREDQVGAR